MPTTRLAYTVMVISHLAMKDPGLIARLMVDLALITAMVLSTTLHMTGITLPLTGAFVPFNKAMNAAG